MSYDLRRWMVLAAVADFFVVRPVRNFARAVFHTWKGSPSNHPTKRVRGPVRHHCDNRPSVARFWGATLMAVVAMLVVGYYIARWVLVIIAGLLVFWWLRPRQR